MRKLLLILLLALVHHFVSYGQNTAERYIRTPSLALKDAQESFNDGDYEKTIKLIKIYQSLSGKTEGGEMLAKAQQCQQISEKARVLEEQGNDVAILQCYREILVINPDDRNARNKVSIVSYDEIGDYYSLGVALVRKGNKWGAIDKDKNIVVPIIYDKLAPFGFFGPKQTASEAKRGGKMVFVDMNGEEVTRDDLYWAIRGIEYLTPNLYYLVYKYDSPEVYVDMNGVEYPTEDEAAYGILGLPKRNTSTCGPYKIGDFYNENGTKGVVFDVDESGFNGKIVSLMSKWVEWAPEGSEYLSSNVGLFNQEDGDSNFALIKSINKWTESFPAFYWCSQLGQGWYLPAAHELSVINDNYLAVNEGLEYAGYRPLQMNNTYMSSTEVDTEPKEVYHIRFYGENNQDPEGYEKWKGYVVAVKKFGFFTNPEAVTTINGHDCIDMGLSVKWATCNVGASSPCDDGDYFAWGEIMPKTAYEWSNYKWCSGSGATFTITKYHPASQNTLRSDKKFRLENEDDAANVNWGESWRIPTLAEWKELRSECIWTWSAVAGKRGFVVTSKKNGNSIFLPAAGNWDGSVLGSAGAGGWYWSSVVDELDNAFNLYFHSNNDILSDNDVFTQFSCQRRFGFSVRPVSK